MSRAELPEDIRDAIGRVHYRQQSDFSVESGYVQTLCAAVQNGNPLYWDGATADDVTGGPTAPLSMLSVWLRPHFWAPGRSASVKPLQLHFDLKERLGYPTAIVTGNELVFHEPVRLGDRLSAGQVLKSVSGLKQTKLGVGRFWVIEMQYRNQREELVGTDTYTCLGYRREAP